jgi:hypothetical protein
MLYHTFIVGVWDYVVSYIYKRAETLSAEKKNTRDLIPHSGDITVNKFGLYNVARRLSNMKMMARIIPNQEFMIQLGNLQVVVCSESIQSVSLFTMPNWERAKKHIDGLVNTFGVSDDNLQQSFHQFSKLKLNAGKATQKSVVPHYTGGFQYCKLPLTDAYCCQMLTIYK